MNVDVVVSAIHECQGISGIHSDGIKGLDITWNEPVDGQILSEHGLEKGKKSKKRGNLEHGKGNDLRMNDNICCFGIAAIVDVRTTLGLSLKKVAEERMLGRRSGGLEEEPGRG